MKYFIEASVLNAVADFLEEIYKDTRERILLNHKFFEKLRDVNHVVVIGWSAGDVDIPYLKEVISKVDKDTTWTVYWYDDIAYNSLQTALKKEGITDKKKISYIQSNEFWDK